MPPTGSFPVEEGGRDSSGGRYSRGVVAHTAALERRITTGNRQQGGQARACPEGGDVIGGPVGVLSLTAVAGDLSVDQPREPIGDRLVVQTQTLEGADPQVRDEYVGVGQEVQRHRQAVGGREVDRDAAFGAVVHLEDRIGGKVTTEHALEHPAGIT